jgi:hypothetical protein
VNRRQLLFRSGATCIAGLSAVSPLGIASAARLAPGPLVRAPVDRVVPALGGNDLGGTVRGTYQLHVLSVAHHTIV